MRSLVPLLTTLLPTLYALSVAAYARIYTTEPAEAGGSGSHRWGPPVLRGAVLLHLLYLIARGWTEGHLPLASVYDFLSATALALASVYLYLEMRQGIRTTGIFVLPLVLLIQLVASAYGNATPTVKPPINPIWFELHTLAAVLGYGAFFVSAIYGILFLLLYREIKGNRMSFFFTRMPPLETLGRMNVSASITGLVLLGLAILMGIGWGKAAGLHPFSDPKTWLTIVAWCLLGFGVLAYHRLGWRGPRAVYASLVGFTTLLLSRVVTDLFVNSFHTFR
ncbi:MAG TPA: cytochrome c biogenesis protein CcsA [Candidatus Eisenbacteria bacterium]|nr:cytochrome c biogenesis protein CcsA [Candidatus Eisenbacteria bacterium]